MPHSIDPAYTPYIVIYPHPKTRAIETDKLLLNAHDLFFGLAQDNIGIPQHVLKDDQSDYAKNRKKAVDKILTGRKAYYEDAVARAASAGIIQEAAAKYVGALVEMIGVLAKEKVELYYHLQKLPDSGKKEKKDIDDKIKNIEKKIGPYWVEAQKLLHHVRLKGNKVDIDGVLHAQLGETFKAAMQRNEIVHNADYGKVQNAMRDVDDTSLWMTTLIPRRQNLLDLRMALEKYNIAVKKRLGVRREDLVPQGKLGMPLRDELEVEISGLKTTIHTLLDENAKEVPESRHIRRGIELVYEMIKQGEKPISVQLLMAMQQVESIANTMIKLACDNGLGELSPWILTLSNKAVRHIEKGFDTGAYRPNRQQDFEQAARDFYRARDMIEISDAPPQARKESNMDDIKAILSSGVALMEKAPPQLGMETGIYRESGIVRKERNAFTEATAAWRKEASAKTASRAVG